MLDTLLHYAISRRDIFFFAIPHIIVSILMYNLTRWFPQFLTRDTFETTVMLHYLTFASVAQSLTVIIFVLFLQEYSIFMISSFLAHLFMLIVTYYVYVAHISWTLDVFKNIPDVENNLNDAVVDSDFLEDLLEGQKQKQSDYGRMISSAMMHLMNGPLAISFYVVLSISLRDTFGK